MKSVLIMLLIFLYAIGCRESASSTSKDEETTVISEPDTPTESDKEDDSVCGFEDGKHSASVDYYNPEKNLGSPFELTRNNGHIL